MITFLTAERRRTSIGVLRFLPLLLEILHAIDESRECENLLQTAESVVKMVLRFLLTRSYVGEPLMQAEGADPDHHLPRMEVAADTLAAIVVFFVSAITHFLRFLCVCLERNRRYINVLVNIYILEEKIYLIEWLEGGHVSGLIEPNELDWMKSIIC